MDYLGISKALKELFEGNPIKLSDLLEGVRGTVIYPASKSNVTLEEALILLGKVAVLSGAHYAPPHVMQLLKSWGVLEEISPRCSDRAAKRLLLFLLGWQGYNFSKCYGVSLEDYVNFINMIAAEMPSKSITIPLLAMGALEVGRAILMAGGSDRNLKELMYLMLYPALGGKFSSSLPKVSDVVWRVISPKVLTLKDRLKVNLPRGGKHYRFYEEIVNLSESYRELATSIDSIMRKIAYMKPNIGEDLERVKEVLNQLGSEIRDWSFARRIRLMDGKIMERRLSFYGFYPQVTADMLNRLEGPLIRVTRKEGVSSIPLPFRERGFSFIDLS